MRGNKTNKQIQHTNNTVHNQTATTGKAKQQTNKKATGRPQPQGATLKKQTTTTTNIK